MKAEWLQRDEETRRQDNNIIIIMIRIQPTKRQQQGCTEERMASNQGCCIEEYDKKHWPIGTGLQNGAPYFLV